MQQPLGQETTEAPTSSIKEQFTDGPATEIQQTKVPTQEEIDAYKDNLLKLYKKELPFMRLKQEYEDLMMKQLIRDVETGARPANTVPGILGLELMMRDLSVKTEMGQWKASFEQQQKAEEEKNKEQEPAIPNTPGE